MNLSELSIRRPVLAWMMMAAIIVFGMLSFQRLGVSQLPDVDFPVVSISLNLNGAAPEVMESQVVDPLEDAIMEIDGIRNLNSSSQQSSGSISIEFDLSKDIEEAIKEVQNKINQVTNVLPINLAPPTIRKINPEDQPIMWVAVTSKNPDAKPIELMSYARDVLNDRFSTIAGVGNVALGGFVSPALRVWADLDKLDKENLTAQDLLSAIQTEQIELPAGIISDNKVEKLIRSKGEATNVKEFGDIPILNRIGLGPNFTLIQLKDVVTVEEGLVDVRKICRSNGKKAVGLGIIKQHGSNAVAVAEAVRAKVKEIQTWLPPQYELSIRSDNTRFIKDSINELIKTLLLSALLTSLVCFLFLGSWTSMINVLLSIPTSVIGTFIAFYAFGFTLNTFTLLGLSLAIGIIVDDAIMMLENIVRHRKMGKTKRKAALVGATEITFSAMVATIAVVAIFLPVVFMNGVIGRYLMQYGITVTVAVLLSLFEALTLTPMRCSRFLNAPQVARGFAGKVDSWFHILEHKYSNMLRFVLSHRWKTVSMAILLFVSSFGLIRKIPSEMLPVQDQSQFMMRFKLPVGSSIQMTNDKMKATEDYLATLPEVAGVFSVVGGFGGDAVNQGSAFVMLVDPKKRNISQTDFIVQLRKELKKRIQGMECVVQDLSLRGFAASRGFPIEFVVQGTDWDTLTNVTDSFMTDLKKSDFAVDVNTDVQLGMKEVQLMPKREAMAAHGISLNALTDAVNALVGGIVLDQETEYQRGLHRYGIELRLVGKDRAAVEDLSRIKMRNNRGQTIALSELVEIKIKPSLMLISRLNRARAITVYANMAPGHAQQDAIQHINEMAKKILPPGYTIKMSGSSKDFQDSLISLMIAMLLGILVSYMVLASQFNSFIHPITVLMALPFSFSGAFLGLALTHQSINMYSMIGFILLMGIVKKNSILLVDVTNQFREKGETVYDALLKACPIRLRPILMTSIATIAGAAPAAFSVGSGSETMRPMAISIMGGVFVSTILTLFVVPVVYSLFSRLEHVEIPE